MLIMHLGCSSHSKQILQFKGCATTHPSYHHLKLQHTVYEALGTTLESSCEELSSIDKEDYLWTINGQKVKTLQVVLVADQKIYKHC